MVKFTGFIKEYGSYGGRLPTTKAEELNRSSNYPYKNKVLSLTRPEIS